MAFTTTLSGDFPTRQSQLSANCNLQLVNFIAGSADAAITTGSTWVDSSGNHIFKVKYNPDGAGVAFWEVGSYQHGDITFGNANGGQLKFGKFHQLAADPSASSTVHGLVWQRTDTLEFRLVVGDATLGTVVVVNDGAYHRTNLPIDADRCDVTNPPTIATKGTTPTVRGRLFSATNQLMSWAVRVPAGFTGAADLKLRLLCVLNQGEIAGDDIDWTVDLTKATPAGSRVVSAAQSSYTVASDMPTNVSDGTPYEVDVVLTYNDATNPIAAGDVLILEIHRTNLSTTGGVILCEASLLTPTHGNRSEA